MNEFMGWTPEQIEDLINRVYNGVVTRDALPIDLYEAIVSKMTEALAAGMAGNVSSEASVALMVKFNENILEFSFAKVFQQVNDVSNFINDADGNKLSFPDFKKKALAVFDLYNGTWLETEFNTAISIVNSAHGWLTIQENKGTLPYLKYITVGDERVRKDHKSLDGIIRPVDDSFWDTHYTPNDFNCRCITDQIEEGEITDLTNIKLDPISKLFRNNPAKTGQVFSTKDHPYFNGLI